MSAPAACPACGGPLSPWRVLPTSDPSLGWPAFPLNRCLHCGTAVTGGPVPPGMYETGAYGSGAPRLHALARPLLDLFDRQRLSFIHPLVPPPARLLDVGAGRGRFVAAAGRAGYDASGLEASRRGVAAATQLGVEVSRARVEDTSFAPASFDAITLWHVLEHLDDPGTTLERIASWLTSDGILLLGVPNLDSLQARLGGERWYHLDVPRHRIHFSLAGLNTLLRAHGLLVLRTHHVLAEHNPYGMWQSLVSRLTRHPSYLYNLLKRNAPLASPDLAITLAALPLAPAAALVELAAGLARRGGTVALVARKA